jgi:hypothetical protein
MGHEMKSRWTILLNSEHWTKWYKALNCAVRLTAPEQYPCLATYIIDVETRTAEFLFVYKQEAYVLNAMPWDHSTYNPDHPLPGDPPR